MISFGNKAERIPIVIIDCYVLVALFLYFFGPIKFKSPFSFELVVYILSFLLCINISYFRAVWSVHQKDWYRNKVIEPSDINMTWKQLPLWFYTLGMTIPLLMIVSAIVVTGFSGITGSLANAMAQSYTFVQSGGTYQQGIDIPMWIYMHFAVFVYLTIVDGLLHFWELRLIKKLLWGASVLFLLGYFILFKGTQKTLGDVFILCASAMLIKVYMAKKKRTHKGMIVLICLVIAFAFALATIMGERIRFLGSVGYDAFKLNSQHWQVDLDSTLLSFLPESTRLGFACLVFYLCNGLCGLSYCLVSPLTWTYGIATFPDLSDILARRLDVEIYKSTYMYEAYLEYGWHYTEQWHTIFPSLASDWTYIGALLVLAAAAYVYAVCWIETLNKRNKASAFLFSLLNIVWVYLPANNQIFSTRTTTLVFLICIIMWIRRKNGDKKRIRIRI